MTPSGAEDEIRTAIASITAEEVRERFRNKDIAWSIVQTPQEVISDPQVTANEYIVANPTDPGRLLVTAPVQFNQRPSNIVTGAPAQGQHSEEILREMGLGDARIADLMAGGVVAQGRQGGWDPFGRLTTV